jgi:hypothetical protein
VIEQLRRVHTQIVNGRRVVNRHSQRETQSRIRC